MMAKVNIGIVPVLAGFGGGVYQYSLTMLQALHEISKDEAENEFIVFAHNTRHPIIKSLSRSGWVVKPNLPLSPKSVMRDVLQLMMGEEHLYKIREWFLKWFASRTNRPNPDAIQYRWDIRNWFNHFGVELMIYPAPNRLSFETGIPYVMAIHDLQHRLQPEFPEVSVDGEWERREYLYRNGTRYATLILADSEIGKEDILNFYGSYGITEDRVKVLPFLPACYLFTEVSDDERRRVRVKYRLPERYLFYPAQFWPHKNHRRIIQALGLLYSEHRLEIPIVFCGTHSGEIRKRTFQEVMKLARELRIDSRVHYLSYVPNEDMSGLYSEAVTLVMPTFFGPTNIPLSEAWAFGCPVLTSDIRGIREQVGDAAVLANPQSVEEIADGIYRLWTNEALRCTLSERGKQRLSCYTPDDYKQRLKRILEEAITRVKTERKLYERFA